MVTEARGEEAVKAARPGDVRRRGRREGARRRGGGGEAEARRNQRGRDDEAKATRQRRRGGGSEAAGRRGEVEGGVADSGDGERHGAARLEETARKQHVEPSFHLIGTLAAPVSIIVAPIAAKRSAR